MQDTDVPYEISRCAAEKIESNRVVLKLVKDSGHSFSRPEDLRIICNSIEEILSLA
jgi:hypothetical protein